jgi:hypothetical protein
VENGTDNLTSGTAKVFLLGAATVEAAEKLTELANTEVGLKVDLAGDGSCGCEIRVSTSSSSKYITFVCTGTDVVPVGVIRGEALPCGGLYEVMPLGKLHLAGLLEVCGICFDEGGCLDVTDGDSPGGFFLEFSVGHLWRRE